jgi:hypothetical protein
MYFVKTIFDCTLVERNGLEHEFYSSAVCRLNNKACVLDSTLLQLSLLSYTCLSKTYKILLAVGACTADSTIVHFISQFHQCKSFSSFFFIHLFICAYIVWAISPPFPSPPLPKFWPFFI